MSDRQECVSGLAGIDYAGRLSATAMSWAEGRSMRRWQHQEPFRMGTRRSNGNGRRIYARCVMNRVMMLASAVLMAGAGVGAVSVTAVAGVAGVAAQHGPKIVAKPDSVMVNRMTTLTGSGFKRHKKLRIWECSARNWVVPKQICNHRNAVTVRTNARGGFRVRFKALVCPASSVAAARKGFSRHCFIGVPTPRGVDVVVLVGATRITVTGP